MDSQVWHDAELWQLWCYCLMRAAYKPHWASVKTGRGQTQVWLEPGQFIFGRFETAKEIKQNPSSVRNRMEKLKSIGNVDIQADTHFSIVTICNWDRYQSIDLENGQAKGQPKDNQRTTKGQPKDTYNKDNKDKKEKKDKNTSLSLPSVETENPKKVKKIFSDSEACYKLAKYLNQKIVSDLNQNFKQPDLQVWSRQIDMLLRLDGNKTNGDGTVDKNEVKAVIDWLYTDDGQAKFWRRQVLSGSGLREKYPKLVIMMREYEQRNQPD